MSEQKTNSSKRRVLIIGSGPCGLGAAYRIQELIDAGLNDVEWTCIEASPEAGGLAASVVDENGFTWDMGGHVIFSHYAYFSRLLDSLIPESGFNTLQREAWVWMRDRFIPYPFQQNIHRLPAEDIIPSLEGLIENDKKRHTFVKPNNFGEWLEQSFGKGLCKVFMTPYNQKVWAYNPDQMNVEWMGERVATVDTAKIVKNVILQQDEIGWGPNSTFRFPLHGGTGAIWKAIYEVLPKAKFQFNKKVTEVNVTNKTVSFADGSKLPYDSLITTMPLDYLSTIILGTSIPRDELFLRAKQFKHSSSHIIGFGIEGQPPEHLKTKCWLYFPESNCPFYRVTVFSNYSPYHVPKPGQQWSLMCEVSESGQKPVDIKTVVKEAEEGCLNTQLIKSTDKILSRFHTRLEYGYPTPFYGRDQLANPIHAELEKHQIFSRGRFGCWKYEVSNQDHSLMLGVEAADRVLFGTEEMTFRFPGVVNANKDSQGRVPDRWTNLPADKKYNSSVPK